jgi:hypothetical protein
MLRGGAGSVVSEVCLVGRSEGGEQRIRNGHFEDR